MPDEATSLHLRNTHELFLLIPIRQGFVEGTDRRMSYASRLRRLLELLFAPTQSVAERSLIPRSSFADDLQNIHHFHYGVVDRLQRSELILSATFDSSWESYFRNLVDHVGPFLDAVFCHCENFSGRTCNDGYEAFAGFIREHQVQAGILYTGTPDVTADDLRRFRSAERGYHADPPLKTPRAVATEELEVWKTQLESDAWQAKDESRRQRGQGIEVLLRNIVEVRDFFGSEELIDLEGSASATRPPRSARGVFDKVVDLLAESLKADLALAKGAAAAATSPFNEKELKYVKEVIGRLEASDRAGKAEDPDVLEARRREQDFADQKGLESLGKRVQVGIVSDVPSSEAVLALLRFSAEDPASALRALASWARHGLKDFHSDERYPVTVALTFAGLRRLGLDEATLDAFPKEFRLGMEQRAGALGDIGWPNHPDYWHQIASETNARLQLAAVDVVVIVHHPSEVLDRSSFHERALAALKLEHGGTVLHTEYLCHLDQDHFGFPRLKSNQPQLSFVGPQKSSVEERFDNRMAVGDLFLGHPDSYQNVARAALPDENPFSWQLFREGTFLVVRKLAMDGKVFRDSHPNPSAALGRDLKDPKLNSEQDYSKDKDGQRVRLDAHVRRVNPRTHGVPRIVRRSFTYEPADRDAPKQSGDTGHMFLAYNASPAQQFEVLQRWINGGNSTGLSSRQIDPVAGQLTTGKTAPPVTLRWGMYLFVPSHAALTFLSEVAFPRVPADEEAEQRHRLLREGEERWLVRRGRALIARLDAETDPDAARASWKQLFEEAVWNRDARAVWAAIRRSGKPKQTPYGLLLGTAHDVDQVLRDRGTSYSTNEYRVRLRECSIDFYLGMDEQPSFEPPSGCPVSRNYRRLAIANEAIRSKFPQEPALFLEARGHAQAYLHAVAGNFDLKDVAREVVSQIANTYVGLPPLPDAAARRLFLDHFINLTRYMSFPYPEAWLRAKAIDAGKALHDQYNELRLHLGGAYTEVAKAYFPGVDPPYTEPQFADIRNALIGANIGFVPPAVSMIVGVLHRWLQNGDLENQPALDSNVLETVKKRYAQLLPALIRDLSQDPTFTTIYRVSTGTNPAAPAGSFVVVGAQSAFDDATQGYVHPDDPTKPYEWIFGGQYKRAAHACPFATYSLEVIAGTVQGMVDYLTRALQGPQKTLTRVGPTSYRIVSIDRTRPAAT